MLRGTTLLARMRGPLELRCIGRTPRRLGPAAVTAAAPRRVQRPCCRLAPPPALCRAPTAPVPRVSVSCAQYTDRPPRPRNPGPPRC